ncbi:MAG: hypothetical protein ACPW61_05835 [Methyloligella sp. ZOD6]
MGLLDLPSPTLSAVDDWLTPFLPPAVKLLLWAALAAILSMEIYRLLSPQDRIAAVMKEFQASQNRVASFDGEFSEAWPELRRMIGLALRRIGLVFPATIAASLPLLFVIVWLDSHYGADFPPPDEPVSVSVPGNYEGRLVGTGEGTPHAKVIDTQGEPVADIAIKQPVPVVHKRFWWNTLIGNPAGYLDDNLPFDRIDIALPRQQIVPFGPSWMRGWEILFLAAMFAFAMTFKSVRRIA